MKVDKEYLALVKLIPDDDTRMSFINAQATSAGLTAILNVMLGCLETKKFHFDFYQYWPNRSRN